MAITRHEPSKIYSKVVEANGFVFTAGITASRQQGRTPRDRPSRSSRRSIAS